MNRILHSEQTMCRVQIGDEAGYYECTTTIIFSQQLDRYAVVIQPIMGRRQFVTATTDEDRAWVIWRRIVGRDPLVLFSEVSEVEEDVA